MMPRWTLGVAFLLGLLPAGILYWQSRRPAQVSPPPVTAPPPNPTPAAPAVEPEPPRKEETTTASPRRAPTAVFDAAELGRMLAERSHQLEAAQTAQADLTRQLRELEAKFDTMAQEDAKRKASEAQLRDLLTAAQKETDAAKIALQAREATLRDAEIVTQQLRKQVADAAQRSERRRQARTELEELGRRRESYLTTIIGRYREATELFRAMSLRLDNPRDAGSPLNNDLSRIQQAIQLADEDLRQLRVLNAQVARIQKELN